MRTVIALSLVLVVSAALAKPPQRVDTVMTTRTTVGRQVVEALDAQRTRVEYTYTDRGHGDHFIAEWTLDKSGIPVRYHAHGHDYMQAPIDERFERLDGRAEWTDSHESGATALDAPAIYVPANPPPEYYGVLARALLEAPGHQLALLPGGTASLEKIDADAPGVPEGWTLYRITGLDFVPMSVWLDADQRTVAIASVWWSTLEAGRESTLMALLAVQDAANQAWAARLAESLTRIPEGDVVIRDARLFDARDLAVTPHTDVLIRGDRIVRVALGSRIEAAADATVIDAAGRFLMPGLWDAHQHFDGVDGMLDIANGVTSGRDMANETVVFPKRVERFDAGTEIGPRVLKAGIIDGISPYSVPLGKLVRNADEALRDVDWYADHGYVQIKTYMSLDPKRIPLIADRAHARGLRLSGHVPAFMSAREFIEAGADEIQHFNYVELQFLYPRVKETTRMSARFLEVAAHAREFTPETPVVREFIAFLKRHHTVLDPTLNLFESRFTGKPSEVTPGLRNVADRFPLQVRRSLVGHAYVPPKGQESAYAEAIPAMLNLLKALHDAGVRILPGTDALAGYMLHHELELYARAGIAPAEVLRMATLTPAEVMGVDKDLGVIAPGKYADMILIDGDPTTNIADIRNVSTVIKGGRLFDPRAIETALGIVPRESTAH